MEPDHEFSGILIKPVAVDPDYVDVWIGLSTSPLDEPRVEQVVRDVEMDPFAGGFLGQPVPPHGRSFGQALPADNAGPERRDDRGAVVSAAIVVAQDLGER